MSIFQVNNRIITPASYPWGYPDAYDPYLTWEVMAPYDEWWDGKTIITVGPSGRDYTDPEVAIEGASDKSLILIDPGTYNTGEIRMEGSPRSLVIRGLGASPEDTIITQLAGSTIYADFSTCNGLLVENIKLIGTTNNRSALGLMCAAMINKCWLCGDKDIIGLNVSAGTWEAKIKNCYLQRDTDYHFSQMYLNHYHLIKSQLNNSKAEYYCTNSWLTLDYVTSATAEYGYGYGDYYVKRVM